MVATFNKEDPDRPDLQVKISIFNVTETEVQISIKIDREQSQDIYIRD